MSDRTPEDSSRERREVGGYVEVLRPDVVYQGRVYEVKNVRETESAGENRRVFVGYPYDLPRDDYRPIFTAVGEKYGVEFLFADEELTNKHILEKIAVMMTDAALSLFDITFWNPNVALELGIAYGRGLDFYILFDPTKGQGDVLADVRGIDRIQYESYAELGQHLERLIRDQFGPPPEKQEAEAGGLMAEVEAMRARIPEILGAEPGQPIGSIASALDVSIDIAQTLVKPMIGSTLETRGVRRGTRYYLLGEAPVEESEEIEIPAEWAVTDEPPES